MYWAVVGDRGLFGSEMSEYLRKCGQDVKGFNRTNLDLDLDLDSLALEFRGVDFVVNAVGYTAVDLAETHEDEAFKLNCFYAEKLAHAARIAGARYFYISTDYVFDGESSMPYLVNSPVNPQTAYGRSKAAGEQAVLISNSDAVIFRTSWLYGSSGKCFPKTIRDRLFSNQTLKVIDDQIGSPTWTRDLAKVVFEHGMAGFKEPIVNAVSSGKASWFEFAVEIAKSAGVAQPEIQAVKSAEFETSAKRPKFSVLDNSGTEGPVIGDWKERWRLAAEQVLAS